MPSAKVEQTTHLKIIAGTVAHVINSFMVERRSRRLSAHTIRFYEVELGLFSRWLDRQGVISLEELTADVIRLYLMDLSGTRNPGGQHASYRAIRALLTWVWDELDIETRNPITRVKAPKVVNNPIEGVSLETVRVLLESAKGSDNPQRDKALLLFLADSGVRAAELCALAVCDVDLLSGVVVVRSGKGGKRRVTDIGKPSRRELRKYLQSREIAKDAALFVTDEGTRLTYGGLRQIIRRRSEKAGIDSPGLHDFRRFAALAWWRSGRSLASISKRLGHSSIEVTRRYLALSDDDLANEAAETGAPSDLL
jgi:site-specific recombinase XerD